MRYLIILYAFALATCQSKTEDAKLKETLEGDWLVVLADHQLANDGQILTYGRIQDSVVDAKCHKLIRFYKDGNFQQVDFPDIKGKWAVSPNLDVFMGNGGKGFEYFKASYSSYKDKELQIVENLHTDGESIKVVWYLRKLKNGDLLDEDENEWRKRPSSPESEKEIKARLAIMLNYYSRYLKLISDESTFFLRSRVILPLKFYQHAMSTLPYNPQGEFAKLFYNPAQSEEAYGYLKRKIYDLGNKYPRGDNFVIEYSKYLSQVGEAIQK